MIGAVSLRGGKGRASPSLIAQWQVVLTSSTKIRLLLVSIINKNEDLASHESRDERARLSSDESREDGIGSDEVFGNGSRRSRSGCERCRTMSKKSRG